MSWGEVERGRDMRHDEMFAATVVARVTGARVRANDLRGAPPRSVDALMSYQDGRRGALEITTLGTQSEFQLLSLLKPHRGGLLTPGRHPWQINVGHARDWPRVRDSYERLILLLEGNGAVRIDDVPDEVVEGVPDLLWLRDESCSTFTGYPDLPLQRGDGSRRRVPLIAGADAIAVWVDGVDPIVPALSAALKEEPCLGHIDKLLLVPGVEERHLFLIVGATGLDGPSYMELLAPEDAPSDDPPVPEAITHVWLCSGYGKRLPVWCRGHGWSLQPYDGVSQ